MLLTDADIKNIVTKIANDIYGESNVEYVDNDGIFYAAFAKAVIAAQEEKIK